MKIGILAIQGAVSEHVSCLRGLGADVEEIRYPSEIHAGLDGIVLPGGESTTMSIVGEKAGLFEPLRDWVHVQKKPIWGTCAGMILLCNDTIKQASCGQSLLGGLDAQVCRNYFGSQMYSAEVGISIHDESIKKGGGGKEETGDTEDGVSVEKKMSELTLDENDYAAVFIRAPAILKVGPTVKVLAHLDASPHKQVVEEVQTFFHDAIVTKPTEAAGDTVWEYGNVSLEKDTGSSQEKFNVKVAVRQDNILATSFHPELTEGDLRWHQYFLDMVESAKK